MLEDISDAIDVVAAFACVESLNAIASTNRALARRDWTRTWKALLAARYPWWKGEGTPRDQFRAAYRMYPILWRGRDVDGEDVDEERTVTGERYKQVPVRPLLDDSRVAVNLGRPPRAGPAGLLLPASAEQGLRFFFGEPFSRTQNRMAVRFPWVYGGEHNWLETAMVGVALRSFAEGPARPVRHEDAVLYAANGWVYGALHDEEYRDLGDGQMTCFNDMDRVTFGVVRPEPRDEWFQHGRTFSLLEDTDGESLCLQVAVEQPFSFRDPSERRGPSKVVEVNLRDLIPEATSIADLVPVVAVQENCHARIVRALSESEIDDIIDPPPPTQEEYEREQFGGMDDMIARWNAGFR